MHSNMGEEKFFSRSREEVRFILKELIVMTTSRKQEK